jgi:hypothetical protein
MKKPRVLPVSAMNRKTLQPGAMGDTGLEPVTPSLSSNGASIASENIAGLATTLSAACTNACTSEGENANAEPIAPDLQVIIDAWPTLPGPIRAGVVALVNASKGVQQ